MQGAVCAAAQRRSHHSSRQPSRARSMFTALTACQAAPWFWQIVSSNSHNVVRHGHFYFLHFIDGETGVRKGKVTRSRIYWQTVEPDSTQESGTSIHAAPNHSTILPLRSEPDSRGRKTNAQQRTKYSFALGTLERTPSTGMFDSFPFKGWPRRCKNKQNDSLGKLLN